MIMPGYHSVAAEIVWLVWSFLVTVALTVMFVIVWLDRRRRP